MRGGWFLATMTTWTQKMEGTGLLGSKECVKLDHMYLIKCFLIAFRGSERLIGGKEFHKQGKWLK